ncbi:Major facilitator superfamily multidrug transporter mdrA [Metarhizium brunneum]|uniref:Major facilitator superfamily multidrug transporter mdrA n=1 Tax=Metarhizium brunneum TaxID=500148 RepID=A0A7D5YME0_9HYPO
MATRPASHGHSDGEEPALQHKIPYWRLVIDQAGVTDHVLHHEYPGSGTQEDPYLVQWTPNDPRNPMGFSDAKKWFITVTVAVATLAVSLVSSAYTGGMKQIIIEFGASQEVATLGVSLFVLGFAVGPLLWAPLSELFGRQVLFAGTYACLTAFNAGCAGAQNIWTLCILRFFAGAFGSSPLTNAGGTIADMFEPAQRGLATAIFAAAPFLGPVLGPIAGGFLGMDAGWRWVMGLLAAFSGLVWILGVVLVPETYAPVILRRRAARLSGMTGKHYVSKMDHDRGRVTFAESFKSALSRPWILLFREPIVFLLSVYMAIVYGTLYMLFGAFPIVYQQHRGWNQGVGGLAFLGIMVGMLAAIAFTLPLNRRYIETQRKCGGHAPPEARLPGTLVGSIALPVGLFWFAWTNSSSVHWIVSILAGVPFGFGMVLVFLSILNYLIDSYTIFAASVLAANSVLRSLFGAAFPMFVGKMYENLGIHWASCIPAFLALACVPFPFLFYKYGASIRAKCKFAAESAAFMEKLRQQSPEAPAVVEKKMDGDATETGADLSSDEETRTGEEGTTYSPIKATQSHASTRGQAAADTTLYDGNPYNIDRVNSNHSFASHK